MVKYSYALDCEDNVVSIKDAEKNKTYFCLNCREPMILRQGNERSWHFAHKNECSRESYLHKLAKKLIMNWFNSKDNIMSSIDTYRICEKHEKCNLFDEHYCQEHITNEYNLKESYSKCTEEKGFKGFTADLYCENMKNPEEPIFIEICVKHKCSEEKINSGIQIIEIDIKNEEDINKIINSVPCRLIERTGIKLYNFKCPPKKSNKFSQPFQKFRLYSSGKSWTDNKSITCRNYESDRKGIFEISMPSDSGINLSMVGKLIAYTEGLLKGYCGICKNKKVCLDYWNGTKHSICPKFKPNEYDIATGVAKLNKYHKKVDIWYKEGVK